MTLDEFNAVCGALPSAELTHPFGPENHIWKVGGKMFAGGSQRAGQTFAKVSFKVPDDTFEILTGEDGVIPAPYMARAKWVQVTTADGMSNDAIADYLVWSHRTYAGKLTRAKRAELGLDGA